MEKETQQFQPLMDRRELERLLIRKAWKDMTFKSQIGSDPKGTIEKYLGRQLPDTIRIFVHEEDANTFHFSVPPMPTDQEVLPDDDMRMFWERHTLAQLFSGIAGGVALTIAANTW